MKDLTLCIACVILGILLSMMFKQACGCKQMVEGFNPVFDDYTESYNWLKETCFPDLGQGLTPEQHDALPLCGNGVNPVMEQYIDLLNDCAVNRPNGSVTCQGVMRNLRSKVESGESIAGNEP